MRERERERDREIYNLFKNYSIDNKNLDKIDYNNFANKILFCIYRGRERE